MEQSFYHIQQFNQQLYGQSMFILYYLHISSYQLSIQILSDNLLNNYCRMLFILVFLFLFTSSFCQDCSSCYPRACGCELFPCPAQPPSNLTDYLSQGLPRGNETALPLVDYIFIATAYGSCRCSYLPFNDSQCNVPPDQGLSIAADIDLSEKSVEDFAKLNVTPSTIEKLQQYIGRGEGAAAVSYCQAQGWARCRVELTESEEQELNQKVISMVVAKVQERYNSAKAELRKTKKFEDLPRGVRTAIVSVYYQYNFGTQPKFWNAVINEQWEQASYELLHMETSARYIDRRKAEEAILRLSLVLPCIPKEPRYQVMFILDSSGSIGPEAYEQEKEFVYNLCSKWKISEENVRVAILIYATTVQLITDFTGNKDLLLETITNIPYLAGATATGDAIREGIQYFINNKAGPAAPRMMFLLTDGWSNTGEDVSTAARDMKAADVNCFAIGVGDAVRREELEVIASRTQNIYNVSSFAALSGILDDLNRGACYSPAIVSFTATSTVTTVLKEYITYFAAKYSRKEGSTFYFYVSDTRWIQVYYSTVTQNPNSEFNTGVGIPINSTTIAFSLSPEPQTTSVIANVYYSMIKTVNVTQDMEVTTQNVPRALYTTDCWENCSFCDTENTTCYAYKPPVFQAERPAVLHKRGVSFELVVGLTVGLTGFLGLGLLAIELVLEFLKWRRSRISLESRPRMGADYEAYVVRQQEGVQNRQFVINDILYNFPMFHIG
eukprot:TRINITY_DN138_c0_g1_i1.p1 TRINITY_DN138_c0_g1~~TRINITY_DN138_c0_g1_i1.p1  ORF type:complete len:725 (-),score=22.55 TRINITY_DN138_c0_g1_i1:26-2200(-)